VECRNGECGYYRLYGHFLDSNGELQECDKTTEIYGLVPKNIYFIKFIKLRAALPSSWEEQADYILPNNIDRFSELKSFFPK